MSENNHRPCFHREDGVLFCEGVSLLELSCRLEQTTYVYSRARIERNYLAYEEALADVPHAICYAMKANSTDGVLQVLARLGAGVMQPRSVEMGKYFNIPIHVRSTFTNKPGTIIREDYTMEDKDFVIRGVAHDEKVAKIAVLGIPNTPGIAHEIFSALAEANIDVDMIVQSIRNIEKNVTDMVFTVATDDLAQAKKVVDKVADKLNAIAVLIEEDVAKVSIVGAGMLGNPGIAARMFGALSKAQINIDIISTSEISISCLVKGSQLKDAVNAIHDEFFPAKA